MPYGQYLGLITGNLKRVIVSVTNDLSTDRRVHRSCMALRKLGYDVLLVGRRRRKSIPLDKRPYRTKRMFLLFEKGFLFYAEYNFRLFFFLIFHKADLFLSNDLDTLLPNYLAKKIKGSGLIYDTHEYFTGVPELEGRPYVQKFWKRIEKWIFPKLKEVITVNDSIAKLYHDEYKKDMTVVRNIPDVPENSSDFSEKELGLDENKNIIILQGSGINVDRGAEEAVLSMQYVDNAVLYIVGDGDVLPILKEMVRENELEGKVKFIPKQTLDKLFAYTRHADIGLTLDKDTNINYRYSLPNKLFDYIHAGVPVLASSLPEIKSIIDKYKVGEMIENHDPHHIAEKISAMLVDKQMLSVYRENCNIAKCELNWKNEEIKLTDVFKRYIK
jgi:glycosyltransferase involved in cell wall biosynthesis